MGAYLTQNTSWTNVEHALRRLRADGGLNLKGIRSTSLPQLEALIRPAGYFRQKAHSLKTFVAYLDQRYGGSLHRMFAQPTARLREELLALHGVGPETADSILLYAGQHPVFVVDAYTRRILDRHGLLPATARYDDIRALFERALATMPPVLAKLRTGNPELRTESIAHTPSPMSRAKRSSQVQVFNEMHGLIVAVGKRYCLKADPHCEQCPLRSFLPPGSRLYRAP